MKRLTPDSKSITEQGVIWPCAGEQNGFTLLEVLTILVAVEISLLTLTHACLADFVTEPSLQSLAIKYFYQFYCKDTALLYSLGSSCLLEPYHLVSNCLRRISSSYNILIRLFTQRHDKTSWAECDLLGRANPSEDFFPMNSFRSLNNY